MIKRPAMIALMCTFASAAVAQCPLVNLGRVPEVFGAVRTSGTPIEGARLSIQPADRKRPPTQVGLGQDGTFRFPRLAPGEYMLLLHRKGFPDNHYSVRVAANARRKPLDITVSIAGAC
ncbi:MAG TPA: carboxypeptidase-like regulatory domain-containing protein [Terriglobales bacterium]|nr:carboxypeptidase-like regulatory domain-containing protein [Terriglobales bacterium]